MNIGELKEVIAAYVQKPLSELTIGGVDLVLNALNNARRNAERLHDWNCEEVTVVNTTTAGVGTWQNLPLLSGGDPIKIKQPITFYLQTDGDLLVPLFHHTQTMGATRAKERMRRQTFGGEMRYGRDLDISYRIVHSGNIREPFQVFMHGSGFILAPATTENKVIVIDAHRWLPPYTDDADEDFFTEHGSDYLMYSGIVELNLLTQTFVPQTEGNLAPPEKARDNALASLLEYDNFITETGRQAEAR